MCQIQSHSYSIFTIIFGLVISFFVLFWLPLSAQDQSGFMYGKVYTNSNTYEGPLRWGKEEVYWMDYFNASKKQNPEYKNMSIGNSDEGSWFDFDWDLKSIWEDKYTVHQFNCQFGDLKQIKIMGNYARLQFKNGWETDVFGSGYNDLEAQVQVIDKELGITAINWNKINKIEFLPSPKKGNYRFGEPVYGTLETFRKEKFTGFIQWDHDERVGTDKLDGNTNDGSVSIAFSEIAGIEKRGNACNVSLKSGREFLMSGSNDVNNENRGICVLVQGMGMVDVPWSAFKKLTLSTKEDSGPAYESFGIPKQLSGKVFLFEDKEQEGKMVYDFDETLDLETLEGKENGLSYTIPFRNIKSIMPKNESFSQVELKTGEKLLLEGSNDVSENNGGVLLFIKGKKQPAHFKRRKIDQIVFD